jgi:succinate dehydrogenase/fumarate reductase flavoprotein subunit
MSDLGGWEVIKTDVLVIGGGFGGLWTAIRAADGDSTVMLVDKSFAGKSGHSYFASGAMMVMLPEDDLREYVSDVVSAVFEDSYKRLKDLESFGMHFRRDKGEYVWTKARGTRNIKNLWPENATAAEEVTMLRKIAIHKGVRFLDHVYIYNLLKDNDDRVVGGMGIGVRDSRNYLFQAKSTVVATNTGGFKGHHLASELQGTGPFMAYEAGAKIKNPEFHYINIRPSKHEIEGSGILPAMGARWVNGKNEYYMDKYDPVLKDRAPVYKIVLAAAREAMKGNIPISIDVRNMEEGEREKFRLLMVSHGWQPLVFEKCVKEEGYDILRDNIDWQPAYESNKLGIDTDLSGESSLKGLFAAGMSRVLGINPFTGWSIASCTWSGHMAGESAARYSEEIESKEPDLSDLLEKKRVFFEPVQRESGVDPDRLIRELQEILFPVDILIIMSESRLKNALKRVIELKDKKLPSLKATDVRTLVKSKEVQTMILSAEMTLRGSLMRKETRESIFYREDYVTPDNTNWLKWIVVKKGGDGEMEFSTEDIPFERYPLKPGV